MRKIVWGVLLTLTFSLIPAYAAAPPKAGSACSKQGVTKTHNGKKFTCIKSRSNLVWSKGLVVKKTIPVALPTLSATLAPTSTSTPTPTPTAAPIPTPLVEKFPEMPTSFADLEEKYQGIPYAVWGKIQSNLDTYKSTDLKITFLFGPTTPQRYPDQWTIDAVQLGSRVMGAQKQPAEVKFVQFNKTDVPWARTEAEKYVSPFRLGITLPDQASEKCAGIDCDGAVTNVASDIGLVLVGVSNPVNRFNVQRWNGQNDLHEYVHAVQGMIFKGKTNSPPPVLMPCWYSEGQPNALSIPTVAKSVEDYVIIRRGWVTDHRWLLKDYEPETIQEFLKKNMKIPCDPATQSMIFTLGYIIMDALVAVGGIDKTFEVLTSIAAGKNFEESFKEKYGIAWSEASVILSKTASRVYKEYRT